MAPETPKSSCPLIPSRMDLTVAPPTPPATQAGAPLQHLRGGNQGMPPTRHPEFYHTEPTLMDPVILQVCYLLSFVVSFQTLIAARPKIPYTDFPSSTSHRGATSLRQLSRSRMMTHRRGDPTIALLSSLLPLPVRRLTCTCVTIRCKSNYLNHTQDHD